MSKFELEDNLWREIRRLNYDYIKVINKLMNTMTVNQLEKIIKEYEKK